MQPPQNKQQQNITTFCVVWKAIGCFYITKRMRGNVHYNCANFTPQEVYDTRNY